MNSDDGFQPVLAECPNGEQTAGEHRAEGKQDHRPSHQCRCLVRMGARAHAFRRRRSYSITRGHVERGGRTEERGTAST